MEAMGATEGRWFKASRYRRRAQVSAVTPLTATGTVRLGFRVVDGEPFHFYPGQFVGVEAHFGGLGYRRSPYCILSAPSDEPVFDLLVRVVPQGPLSQHLATLAVGDEVAFRGPTGRSMVPPDDDRALALFATGTGVAPFYSLASHLLAGGYSQPIVLWWGLRLVDDVCLTDELDALAAATRTSPITSRCRSLPQSGTACVVAWASRYRRCWPPWAPSASTWPATGP